jgi:hypothetical protein
MSETTDHLEIAAAYKAQMQTLFVCLFDNLAASATAEDPAKAEASAVQRFRDGVALAKRVRRIAQEESRTVEG